MRPGEVCVLTESLTTDVSGVPPRLTWMRCTGTFVRDRDQPDAARLSSPGRFPGGRMRQRRACGTSLRRGSGLGLTADAETSRVDSVAVGAATADQRIGVLNRVSRSSAMDGGAHHRNLIGTSAYTL